MSFDLLWRLNSPATDPQPCHICEALTWFRSRTDPESSNHQWVCPDHFVSGLTIHFPQDNPHRTLNSQVFCPVCHQTQVQLRSTHTTVEGRQYARNQCRSCVASWLVLQGRGDETDGSLLGNDLLEVLTDLKQEGGDLTIRVGHVAKRTLERHYNEDLDANFLNHPVTENDDYGSNVVLVITTAPNIQSLQSLSRVTDENATDAPLEEVPFPTLGPSWIVPLVFESVYKWVAPEAPCEVGEEWVLNPEGGLFTDNDLYKVEDINLEEERVTLQSQDRPGTLKPTFDELRDNFMKLERKNIYHRLLEDD